jgi:hypothetical protein
VAEIRKSEGASTLWSAPTLTGGRCTWVEFAGDEIPAFPCLPEGYEHQTALAFTATDLSACAGLSESRSTLTL